MSGDHQVTNVRQVMSILPQASIARIEATRLEREATLVSELSHFWKSSGTTLKELIDSHDPSELIPMFERFAEAQLDCYAEEMLPQIERVDDYVNMLSIHVIDHLLDGIRPHEGLGVSSPNTTTWAGLWTALNGRNSALKRNALDALRTLSTSQGDWETYVRISIQHHWVEGGFKDLPRHKPDAEKAVFLMIQCLHLRYTFHLRLFANCCDFEARLRSLLSRRVAFWFARAQRRLSGACATPETIDSFEAIRIDPSLRLLDRILHKKSISIEVWAMDHKLGRSAVFSWKAARRSAKSLKGKVSTARTAAIEEAIERDAKALGFLTRIASD